MALHPPLSTGAADRYRPLARGDRGGGVVAEHLRRRRSTVRYGCPGPATVARLLEQPQRLVTECHRPLVVGHEHRHALLASDDPRFEAALIELGGHGPCPGQDIGGASVIGAADRDIPVDPQRFGAQGARLGVEGEGTVEPVRRFGERAGVRPVEPEGSGQPHPGTHVARVGEAEVESGAEVRMLRVHPSEPGQLLRAEPLPLAMLGEGKVPVRVPAALSRLGAGFAQPALAVFAECLQQPEPDLPVLLADLQDGLGHKPVEDADHRLGIHVAAGADALRGVQREAAGEHRQARPHHLLRWRAQIEAPFHGRAEGAQVRRGVAAAGVQDGEPVVQPAQDLFEGERPQPDRGQLDGQRQPVQPPADRRHRVLVLAGEGEGRHGRSRAFGEEGHRRERCPATRHPRIRHRQRRYRENVFAGRREDFPAGDKDPCRVDLAQQDVRQLRAGVHQVLAVVQHEQRLPGAEELDQQVQRRSTERVVNAQRLHDREGHQRGVADLSQFDQPGAVAEVAPDAGRGTQREPGLADARRAGQGHQPGVDEQAPDLDHFGAAVDEAGDLGGQVANLP